jgi:hypothetical protein
MEINEMGLGSFSMKKIKIWDESRERYRDEYE